MKYKQCYRFQEFFKFNIFEFNEEPNIFDLRNNT